MAKIVLDTDPQFDKTLADLVNATGGTEADVLRKAVATYKYLKEVDTDPNTRVSITRNGTVEQDVVLP